MKNNFITKIIGATLAFAMMIGGAIGINAAKQAKEASADDAVSWTRITSVGALTAGTYIIGYEANAGSGTIIPLRSDGANATTSANGYFYTGTTKGSSNNETLSMSTLGDNGSAYEVTISVISTGVINIQNAAGQFYGASSGGGSKNTARLYTVGNSNETNLTVNYSNNKFGLTAGVSGQYKYMKYNTGSPRYAFYNSDANDTSFYKKVVSSSKVIQANSVSIKCGNDSISGTYEPASPYYIGDTLDLTSSVVNYQTGEDYQDGLGAINWASSNVDVASINDGIITFVNAGTTTITATAEDKGADNSVVSNSFVLNISNAGPAHGSVNNPYTVAEARAAIDVGANVTDVYVSGIVSKIVTEFNAQYGNISYNISDDGLTTSSQLEVFRGKSFNGENFTSSDDIRVGAIAKIKGNLTIYKSTYEFEEGNVLISYRAPWNVSFVTNGGSSVDTQVVLDGDTAQRPANPTKAADEDNTYTFVDWYQNSELTGDPFDFDTPITSDKVLYAKWNSTPLPAAQVVARLNTKSSLTYHYSKEGEAVVDTLTRSLIGITGTSYTAWEDLQATSDAVYAGKTSGSNSSIQLNNNDKKPGIVTTVSGGNAKKVTVVWNNNTTSGRSITIYGKNTAYEAVTDLYDDEKKGTSLGTIVCETSTVLEISGNYAYIGIFANGSLNLDSIKVQWGEESFTYSNVGVRFTGSISTTLWERLDNESTIEGYGIMYATEAYLSGVSIKGYYDLARADESSVDDTFTAVQGKSYKMVKGLEIKSFYTEITNERAHPAQVGDEYGWNLFKNISNEELATPFTAVAYIRTTADEIIFLDEITKSAAQLAQDLIDADNEYDETSLEGSLADLASKA